MKSFYIRWRIGPDWYGARVLGTRAIAECEAALLPRADVAETELYELVSTKFGEARKPIPNSKEIA